MSEVYLEPLFPVDLSSLLAKSNEIFESAVAEANRGRRRLTGVVILFSGGNDSTTVAHMFRDRADYAAHANTGIGIEQTRQFVRDTCREWGLPLLEGHPAENETYRESVLKNGFPGPMQHTRMYVNLKQNTLLRIRDQLIEDPRRDRLIFLTGLRAAESPRRWARYQAGRMPIWRWRDRNLWVNPIIEWTKLDINTYKRANPDFPRNEVSDLLHMSGECLCGAFIHSRRLDEIAEWYPEVVAEIRTLEAEAEALGHPNCRWGKDHWIALSKSKAWEAKETGPMCSTCDAQYELDGGAQ